MKITVFGANGKVGSLVVAKALKRGHEVIAFVHSQSNFETHDKLRIVRGDVYDALQVALALKGSGAVISALGSWGTPKKDILASGMRHIIPAMLDNNIERIVSITGSGANAPDDTLSATDKAMHRLMDTFAHKVLYDGEEHIRLLRNSRLGWTVIRSPIMNTLGNPKKYALTAQRPSSLATINRYAVAVAMIDLLESSQHQRQSPFITR